MGPIHLHTKNNNPVYKQSLRREDVDVIRHKHKGYCTSLCSFCGETMQPQFFPPKEVYSY